MLEQEMAKIDEDWGGIVDLGQGVRIGFGNQFILVERTTDEGKVGVYNLAHIPDEQVEAFLAWKASMGA